MFHAFIMLSVSCLVFHSNSLHLFGFMISRKILATFIKRYVVIIIV